jgi:hypothetical protein
MNMNPGQLPIRAELNVFSRVTCGGGADQHQTVVKGALKFFLMSDIILLVAEKPQCFRVTDRGKIIRAAGIIDHI